MGSISILRRFGSAAAVAVLASLWTPASAQLLGAANWFEREVGDGIVWRYYHFDNLFGAKQSVSYMEVDLSNPNVNIALNFQPSYTGPNPGTGHPDFPRQLTSVLAMEVPNAKAAVNGTYFNTKTNDPVGEPWGGGETYLKVNGTVIHNFDEVNLNRAEMGILFNNTNDLNITRRVPAQTTGYWNSIESSWQNMMICGPVILDSGVVETFDGTNTHATARHPRTAVGINNTTNKVYLLTVDGRTDQSAGMSCNELGQVMFAIGAEDGINLDGGGSTTLWAAGEPYNGVVNYPSDNSAYDHLGERRGANTFVATSIDPTPASWDGRMTALTYSSLTRTGEDFTVTATYTNLGTQTWTAADVAIVPSRAFGRTSDFIPAGEENTFYSMTPASVAPGETATFTLSLTPPSVVNNTLYEENFALWHATEGYFGPADSELKVRTTVRPEIVGAPPLMIVQGTATGPNNQWYVEGPSWANSTVSFTAEGVSNSGSQRYTGASASALNKYADFKPMFDVQGIYEVAVAYPASSNNISGIQYTVNHMNGSNSFIQGQSTGANTWQILGDFEFSEGIDGDFGVHSVRVSNPTYPGTGNRFYSGAVRFDFKEATGATPINGWFIYQ